ncbi:MAG: hypothetical protein U0X87_17325 [Anaerolineales bacterium]
MKHTEDYRFALETVEFGPIRHRAFKTADAPLGGDAVSRGFRFWQTRM